MSDLTEVLARSMYAEIGHYCLERADRGEITYIDTGYADKAEFWERIARAQLDALAAAGLEIVPKVRCSLCGGLSVTDSGECPDCPAAPKVE